MSPRVVITGMGALSAAGEGARTLWQAVSEGRTGLGRVDAPGASGSWQVLAGVVRDFSPERYVTQRKALKVMARDIQLAVGASSLAMEDAGLKGTASHPERFGVIVGSGVLNHELDELAYSIQNSLDEQGKLDLQKFGDSGLSSLFPLWLLKYLPNMPACHISILFDLQGLNNTITTGASAGLQAVGEAFRIIQRGDADRMLCGGAESKVNPVGISQYRVLGAISDPLTSLATDYRPFDANSRGFVVGEGAAFLVLEELSQARARNAKIYAEVVGFGASSVNGRAAAMQEALNDAGIRPQDLSYLQAAGLGLKEDDEREARAIEEVFNGSGKGLSVSASKAVTGFTGFSAGALDLVISTKALHYQTVPPAAHYTPSGAERSFSIATEKISKKELRYAMTNAFGFNGQAVSVVTKAWEA